MMRVFWFAVGLIVGEILFKILLLLNSFGGGK